MKKSNFEIRMIAISDLQPAEYNPREITSEALEGLKASIKKHGITENIIVNKDLTIISGHQRVKACYELGILEVPCRVLDLSKEDEKILNIAMNNPHIQGTFSEELQLILEEIKLSPDFVAMRIDELQLEKKSIEVNEDDFEPPREAKYKVQLGDLFQLGNHRLMCGDSTKIEDVEKLMNGEKADMVFTDPPYNADYSSRVDKTRRRPWGGIMNDNMTYESFEEFLTDINSSIWTVLKQNGVVYECIDWKHYPQLVKIYSEAFNHKSTIIWNKNYFGLGTYYRTKYEMILFGVKGEKLEIWNAGHDEMDVWEEDREKTSNYVHPTQKPIEIPARAIKNSSNEDQIILDLFGGSGSTLIACEQLNRKCYMMELDPYYCSVIIERWEKLTGQNHRKIN